LILRKLSHKYKIMCIYQNKKSIGEWAYSIHNSPI